MEQIIILSAINSSTFTTTTTLLHATLWEAANLRRELQRLVSTVSFNQPTTLNMMCNLML